MVRERVNERVLATKWLLKQNKNIRDDIGSI